MARINQPQSWTFNPTDLYGPIFYEGQIVGYCTPTVATRIIETLNDDQKLRKALWLACRDLAAQIGEESEDVDELVEQYIARAERPRRGAGAIALLLKERQDQLDLTHEEFAKFCDTFRLSQAELLDIYDGQEIESQQLTPLSRILGMTVDQLIEVWKGDEGEG
ncbi:MAG: hypothetical protein HC866_18250 [Leptolyngbyaceae cyanobacterium RU_5_1]|nr:hypothetical protein [Leptolyngbyaceae cyanobacterium RU_5_1]